ncbi:MAG: peptide ABC transporter permease, partial [Acidimicrobiales bacterium]
PGVAISLMVLAFNLAGDGLRDLLDPRFAEGGFGEARNNRRRARPPRLRSDRRSAEELVVVEAT